MERRAQKKAGSGGASVEKTVKMKAQTWVGTGQSAVSEALSAVEEEGTGLDRPWQGV